MNIIYEKVDGFIQASLAELPGAISLGNSVEEARRNLDEAIEMVLEGQDLLSANESSLDCWKNPLDDEDWNNLSTKLDS